MIEQLVSQGIVGIVTGIVTTALLFIVKQFWVNNVTPFLASVQYQGVKVEGVWIADAEGVDDNGNAYKSHITLDLTQRAHALTGSFTHSFSNTIKSFSINYEVTGQIWEGYLSLSFVPKDKRITSYGGALVKIHDGGLMLTGKWIGRDVTTDEVLSLEIVLMREDPPASFGKSILPPSAES